MTTCACGGSVEPAADGLLRCERCCRLYETNSELPPPNRARCELCQTVVESLDERPIVFCACRSLGVSGGQRKRVRVVRTTRKDWTELSEDLK